MTSHVAALWFRENTMIIELEELKNETTGVAITDADVVAEIRVKGTEVPIDDGEFELTHTAGGTYRVEADAALDILVNKEYVCIVTAVKDGKQARWTKNFNGSLRYPHHA